MHFPIDLIRLVMFLAASLGALTPTFGQSGDSGNLCELSEGKRMQAVLSFRTTRVWASHTSRRSFLAVWHEGENVGRVSHTPAQLVVCEKNGLRYKEVFRFEDKEQLGFLEFAPLSSLTVPGLVVTFSSDIGWNGPTLVIALVQEKFEVVYRGATSELVDLDGNGIPEIFESLWPDGDGYPRTTTIHVWDGARYRKLTTSGWEHRFSSSVLSRTKSYNSARLRQNRKHHSAGCDAILPSGGRALDCGALSTYCARPDCQSSAVYNDDMANLMQVSDVQLMALVAKIAAGADETSANSLKTLDRYPVEGLAERFRKILLTVPDHDHRRTSVAFVLCLLNHDYENNKNVIVLELRKEPHHKNLHADWEAELIHRLIRRGDSRLLSTLFEVSIWADGAMAAALSGYLTFHLRNRAEQFLEELRLQPKELRQAVSERIIADELLTEDELARMSRNLESVPETSPIFKVAREMLITLRKDQITYGFW